MSADAVAKDAVAADATPVAAPVAVSGAGADTKAAVVVGADGDVIESDAGEVYDSFDAMGLREELLVRTRSAQRFVAPRPSLI